MIAELLLIKILVEKTVFRYLGKNIRKQFLRLSAANPAARSRKRHRNSRLQVLVRKQDAGALQHSLPWAANAHLPGDFAGICLM